jgi:hypothetical protein
MIIIGANGFAKEVYDVLLKQNRILDIVFFDEWLAVDSKTKIDNRNIFCSKVLNPINDGHNDE